jgi:hypothetical protein
MIDSSHFTPAMSFAGGVLIGLAAAMLILVNGRVAGISGIVGGMFMPRRGDVTWRLAFIAGLLGAPLLALLLGVRSAPRIDAGLSLLLAAGLLVGVGTSYASGCTSGHGVCGLARLSPRSFAATLAFMAAGMLTVFVVRHAL